MAVGATKKSHAPTIVKAYKLFNVVLNLKSGVETLKCQTIQMETTEQYSPAVIIASPFVIRIKFRKEGSPGVKLLLAWFKRCFIEVSNLIQKRRRNTLACYIQCRFVFPV